MEYSLVRQITRRNPFSMVKLPWIARVYRYPLDKWSTPGRQALFGAPNFLLFLACQKLVPWRTKGIFTFKIHGQERQIGFDARNTQFCALYGRSFAFGYEPQVSALLEVITPDNGVFLDIGSNWGWFSLLIASKPGFIGQIHAFEPFPSTFADLASVVRQSGLSDCVTCHQVALWNQIEQIAVYLPDLMQSGAAAVCSGKTGRLSKRHGIKTLTLDSLKLENASVLKIDVEGSELRVLQGGIALLRKFRPMIVFENARHLRDPSQTLAPMCYLRDLGYLFFQLGWVRQCDGARFILGDDLELDGQASEILSLTPLRLEERYLRPPAINILACHETRIAELEAEFSPATEAGGQAQ